ncbi:MAG: hypothetical protein HOC71_05285, partial [Candidatus Latescibacteria bacterium]|nr:hypothetical protein [Candidatus Latescibacterota bacterium]
SADSVWSRVPMIPHAVWPPSPAYQPVAGAHKALIEGHVQLGIVNSEVFLKTLDDYGAIVLPGQRILSESECEAIRSFVRNGGSLIATEETGTRDTKNNRLDNFSISDVLGIKYMESSDTANSYLRVPEKIEEYGIPAYDIPVAGKYVRVESTTAKTLLELMPPYEGIKTGTPPPAEFPSGPGVTLNNYGKGKAIYCASELFSGYYVQGTPLLRKLALWMLGLIYPDESRTIAVENTPINVEVFYNQRGKERFVHLVNYSGDKREVGASQAQDFPVVHGNRVRLRLSTKPAGVTAVPGGDKIAFTYRNGWVVFDAKPLDIHSVYRIEV